MWLTDCRPGRLQIRAVLHSKPRLILLDYTMPGLSGIDMIPRIRSVHPTARIVMVTHLDSREVQARALAAGADGFVSKNAPFEQLLATIDSVLARESQAAARGAGAEGCVTDASPLASLSVREREVLQLLVLGLANKEIAARLGISV